MTTRPLQSEVELKKMTAGAHVHYAGGRYVRTHVGRFAMWINVETGVALSSDDLLTMAERRDEVLVVEVG